MQYIKYVLSFTLLLILAGCNESNPKIDYSKKLLPEDITKATVYFDKMLDATLKVAKEQKNPYDSYSLLVKAYYGADSNRNPIVYKIPDKLFVIKQSKFSIKVTLDEPFGNYQNYGSYEYGATLIKKDEALSDLFEYLDMSLKLGNKKAFIELYEAKKPYFEDDLTLIAQVDKLQIKYADAFKILAESLTVGETIDEDLILLYGYQYRKGFIYPKNTAKSVEYYQKLYPNNKNVAFDIISSYLEINDFENAYFWKVRCIDSCTQNVITALKPLSYKATLDDIFREKLTSTQFKEIEVAANDPKRKTFK